MRSQYVFVNNLRVHVATEGTGPALALVHGIGGPLMWQRLIPLLALRCTVHCIDLPGFGKSDPPKTATTDSYAETLGSVLMSLNPIPPCVVGISYGGQVALACARAHPEVIDRLVLVASTGLFRPRVLGSAAVFRALVRIFAPVLSRSRWMVCRMGARSFFDISRRPPDLCGQFFAELSASGSRAAWLHCLSNITNEQQTTAQNARDLHRPALIVWGREDRTVQAESAEEFNRLIARSRLILYDQCAHSVPLEQPQRLASDILEFMNSQPSSLVILAND